MNFKILLFGLILSLLSITAQGQSPLSAEEIKKELQSRGVSEAEVEEFLASKSLTTEDLETLSPSEYIIFNEQFNTFVEEKRTNGINQVSASDPEVVKNVYDETIVLKDSTKESISEKRIQIYGQQLFKEGNFPLMSGEGLVPGTYILDVGDEVSISIFGNSQLSKIFSVNEEGAILYNSGRQRVIVAGLSLNEARAKLERVFKKTYSFNSGDFNVNVVGARTITVSIYGEVKNSGGYILSAVNSPINAIQAAGGITTNGSYRNIKIFKSTGEVKEIDLYKYLNNPSQFKDVGLTNNDIIQVPSRNNLVSLKGSVVRPLDYELKQGEKFSDLINYAGGFKSDANIKTIELQRFIDGKLKIINLDFEVQSGKMKALKNGDVIDVYALNKNVENLVSISGAINNPGNYELKKNMKLSDLIRYTIFNEKSKLDVALIKRVNPNGKTDFIKVNLEEVQNNISSASNIELQNGDELLVWSIARFIDSANALKINGAVKFPGQYSYKEGDTRLSDLIYFAGGLRRDASEVGMIFRKDPLNTNKIEYIRFDPYLKNGMTDDLLLMPFDSIVVLKDELLSNSYTVQIEGQVKKEGSFKYGEGMTVKDLVVLAEGFKISAYTNEVEISRLVLENNKPTEVKVATISVSPNLAENGEGANYELQPFDKVFVRTVSDFEKQKIVSLSGEVKYPGNYVILEKNEKLSSVIKRAGGLTSEAFVDGAKLERSYNDVGLVVMNLDQAMKFNNSKYNYILKSGDKLIIPKNDDIVTLKSSVLYKRNTNLESISGGREDALSMAFFPGKRADYYIRTFAGGFDEQSDKRNIFVEHPNGEVAQTKSYGFFNVYPKVRSGSTIIIPNLPPEIEADKDKEDIDWTTLLGDSVTQAMSIITLLLLIERI